MSSLWNSWSNNPLVDLTIIGIDSVICGILYTFYTKRNKIVRNIIEAPSVNVGPDVHDLLKQQSDPTVIPYVAIRGKVKELGRVIESSTGLKGVMQRSTVNEHSIRRQNFGHWRDVSRTISQTQNDVPFVLKNLGFGQNVNVEIITPFEAEQELLLIPVSTQFSPSTQTAASTVVGFFTGVASKGVETSEELLPVDTLITGIGKLIKESNGKLKLAPNMYDPSSPYYLTSLPVESLIKKLERRRDIFKFFTYVFFAVGLVVGTRRLYFVWKAYQLEKVRQKILKRRSEIDSRGLSDAQLCIICLENPREVILLGCGHVCICADCVSKVDSKCPICRAVFMNTHPAYIA